MTEADSIAHEHKVMRRYRHVAALEVGAAALAGQPVAQEDVMRQNLFLATNDDDPRGRRNATGMLLRSVLPYSSFGEQALVPLDLVDGVFMIGATPDREPDAVDNLSHTARATGFEVTDVKVVDLAQQELEEKLASFRSPSPDRIGAHAVKFAEDPDNGSEILGQLLDDVLAEALDQGASDVDFIFQPETRRNWIAYHVDSERDLRHNLPAETMARLVSLVKQRARCHEYAVRNKIQSGRLSIPWQGRLITGRVATSPLEPQGEEVAVRLLDLAKLPPLRVLTRHMPEVTETLMALIRAPGKASGLVLVSGPTNQGKTTTLASIEAAYDRVSRKIIEVSSPPEYLIPYVLAEDATGEQGRTVADHVIGALRRTPNVLVIQEVRTIQDGDASAQAVDSGHMTYLTLHAGDAPMTVQRYVERLGPDNQRIAHSIVGDHLRLVINQRLIPQLCHACRIQAGQARRTFDGPDFKLLKIKVATPLFDQRPEGCRYCRHTGINGLALAAETMILPRDPAQKNGIIDLIRERRYEDLPHADGVRFTPRVERLGKLLEEGLIGASIAKRLMAVA